MKRDFFALAQLKDSPQWILLPHKERRGLYLVALTATLILCIVSIILVL